MQRPKPPLRCPPQVAGAAADVDERARRAARSASIARDDLVDAVVRRGRGSRRARDLDVRLGSTVTHATQPARARPSAGRRARTEPWRARDRRRRARPAARIVDQACSACASAALIARRHEHAARRRDDLPRAAESPSSPPACPAYERLDKHQAERLRRGVRLAVDVAGGKHAGHIAYGCREKPRGQDEGACAGAARAARAGRLASCGRCGAAGNPDRHGPRAAHAAARRSARAPSIARTGWPSGSPSCRPRRRARAAGLGAGRRSRRRRGDRRIQHVARGRRAATSRPRPRCNGCCR